MGTLIMNYTSGHGPALKVGRNPDLSTLKDLERRIRAVNRKITFLTRRRAHHENLLQDGHILESEMDDLPTFAYLYLAKWGIFFVPKPWTGGNSPRVYRLE